MYICNPSILEAEAEGTQAGVQPWPHSKVVSQKQHPEQQRRSGARNEPVCIMPSLMHMQSSDRTIHAGNKSVMPHKLLFPLLASGKCVEDVRVRGTTVTCPFPLSSSSTILNVNKWEVFPMETTRTKIDKMHYYFIH